MVTLQDYGEYEAAWCPGCGNFLLLKAVKQALVAAGLLPDRALFVSGIGQAAKAPHYLNANLFNGLHGRALPAATGAKLSNPELTVIVESGDGCMYGEGGNHFLAAIRRNVDLTVLTHNNQVYALTKGQASPTSDQGYVTKAQPEGVTGASFNAVAVATTMHANFVARGFVGLTDHLAKLIQEAIAHPGFALVEILQNCPTFNHVNTFAWYKQRVKELPPDYDPENWELAMKTAQEWGERIPIGIISRNRRPPYLQGRAPLVGQPVDRAALREIMESLA